MVEDADAAVVALQRLYHPHGTPTMTATSMNPTHSGAPTPHLPRWPCQPRSMGRVYAFVFRKAPCLSAPHVDGRRWEHVRDLRMSRHCASGSAATHRVTFPVLRHTFWRVRPGGLSTSIHVSIVTPLAFGARLLRLGRLLLRQRPIAASSLSRHCADSDFGGRPLGPCTKIGFNQTWY
jgi:hypothetical protein